MSQQKIGLVIDDPQNLNSQRDRDDSQLSRSEQDRQTSREITIPSTLFQALPQPAGELLPAKTLLQDTGIRQHHMVTDVQRPVQQNETSAQCLMGFSPRNKYQTKLSFDRKLADGICKGLEALLTVTGKSKADRSYGTRSLFSTCLRNVPLCIAQQEEESMDEAEDVDNEVSVSSMMYSDLESLSTSEICGWDPLRLVVRAHGISMVGSIVREGLVGHHVARTIIAMCGRQKAYDEAQQILQCLIESIEPSQPLQNSDTLQSILSTVHDFVAMTGRHSMRYETLTRLLHSGNLTLDYIARHDMIDTWNRVVQSIIQCDEHATSANELLRLAIGMSCGLMGHLPSSLVHGIRLRKHRLSKKGEEYIASLGYQGLWPRSSKTLAKDGEQKPHNEKAHITVSILLTVFCAVGLLRSAVSTSSSKHLSSPGLTILQDVAVDAQQMLALASDRMSMIHSDRITVSLLAAALVQATLCHSLQQFNETIPTYIARLSDAPNIESVIEEGGSFLCAVAGCCARATSDELFVHIQKILQHTQCIATALKPIPASQQLCNRIGLAAAFEYAEATKHPKHLHWALDIEQMIAGATCDSARRPQTRTPLRDPNQTKNGYRWEAGICEWVAKTPANALYKASSQHAQHTLKGMFGDISSLACTDIGSNGMVPSPCSSNSSSSRAFRCSPINVKHRSADTRPVRTAIDDGSAKKLFFSHIYIEAGGRELSMPGSLSETTTPAPYHLQDITNSASRWRKGRWINDRRREINDDGQAACNDVLWGEAQEKDGVGIDVHDILLDSEDELSYL
ncbi:MAG: hypothetical protein Q9220_001907 [cf. Caloplaca sp. 1 TL-2023]